MSEKQLTEPTAGSEGGIMPQVPVLELSSEESALRRKLRLDEKQYVTGRVGETCRYIGFGLVAVFYGIVTSSEALPKQLLADFGWWIRAFGAFGALTILTDYLQYLAGDFAARSALSRKDQGEFSYLYNKKWFSYRLRTFCYGAKQIFALIGATILTVLLILTLV